MDESKDLQNNPIITEDPLDPLPDVNIPALRTYKGDINQTVNQDKISTAKILIAEQKAKEKQQVFDSETSVTKPKNLIATVFGLFFMVAALGIIGFFGYDKLASQTPINSIVPESFFLFAFDEQVYIDMQKSKTDIFLDVQKALFEAEQGKDNTYSDIIFYNTDQTTDTTSRITSAELLQLYGIRPPSVIGRSISKDFVYGLYKTGIRVEPFLVIGLADYENAYSAMFDWEDTLALDMKGFFPVLQEVFRPRENVSIENAATTSETVATTTAASTVATSTSTTSTIATTSAEASTVPVVATPNRNVTFTDVVLSNRDTRAIRDENGTPFFYYTFIDRDKILFAQDPKLITEIIRKIKEKQLVR